MIQQTQQKNNFSPFLGSIGWKQECATKKSEIVRVDELYPNSLMELCLCLVVFLYRNIAHFGKFWSNFHLIHSSYWYYAMATFLLEIVEPRYAFFVKDKNMVKN